MTADWTQTTKFKCNWLGEWEDGELKHSASITQQEDKPHQFRIYGDAVLETITCLPFPDSNNVWRPMPRWVSVRWLKDE